MRFVEVQYQGPLPRPAQWMNPAKVLEDPARRGVLDRLSFLIGKGRLMGPEGLADAILQSGIDQQTHRHQLLKELELVRKVGSNAMSE
jgi:hypothetical protein